MNEIALKRRIVALLLATLLAATLPRRAGRNIFIAGSSAVHRRLLPWTGALTGYVYVRKF